TAPHSSRTRSGATPHLAAISAVIAEAWWSATTAPCADWAATDGACAATEARTAATRTASAHHRIGHLGELLAHTDRLGVDLVGPERGDHVDHLAHDLDVARLEAPLDQPSEAVVLREPDHGLAGRGRLGEEVLAEREEPRRVREARELDLAQLDRLGRVADHRRDDAGPRDVQRRRLGRDRDPREQRVAAARDQDALVGDREAAVPGVRDLAARELDLEEAVALDREVERAAGRLDRALRVDALDRREPGAAADLDRGDADRVRVADRDRSLDRLVEQVLEVRTATLEPGRVHVRQIVRDDLDAKLLRHHPRGRSTERRIHLSPPFP